MTFTVEDLLEKLSEICSHPPRWANGKRAEIQQPWDRKFITDIAFKTAEGKQISTAQAEIAIKVINRFHQNLVAAGLDLIQIKYAISNPTYRQPPYQSVHMEKEVRWAGRRKIFIRSKFNGAMNEDLARLPVEETGLVGLKYPDFSSEKKGGSNVWVVEIHGKNLEPIMEILGKYNILGDEPTAQFFKRCYDTEMLQSTASMKDDRLVVEVQNDPFLTSWLETVLFPEERFHVG